MLPTIIPTSREGFQTVLRGRASWYGKFFQGMATASGERYDRFKYTCAHKKLPFGTRLRVTNLENGVTVVVRVTDRGPFRKERIIDLSEKAARPLGLVQAGSATVIAVVVPSDTPLGLADTPADLTTLRAGDPYPRAPFTAYLLPLLQQPSEVVAAAVPPATPLATSEAIAAPSAMAAPAVAAQAGLLPAIISVNVKWAGVQADKLTLPSSSKGIAKGQQMNQVFANRLDSWLAAETVRRNLQAGNTANIPRLPLPGPLPSVPDEDGAEAAMAALN